MCVWMNLCDVQPNDIRMCWNIAVINAKAMRAMQPLYFTCHLMNVLNPFRFFFHSRCKNNIIGAYSVYFYVLVAWKKNINTHTHTLAQVYWQKQETKMTASLSSVVLLWKAINKIEYDALDNYYYGARLIAIGVFSLLLISPYWPIRADDFLV